MASFSAFSMSLQEPEPSFIVSAPSVIVRSPSSRHSEIGTVENQAAASSSSRTSLRGGGVEGHALRLLEARVFAEPQGEREGCVGSLIGEGPGGAEGLQAVGVVEAHVDAAVQPGRDHQILHRRSGAAGGQVEDEGTEHTKLVRVVVVAHRVAEGLGIDVGAELPVGETELEVTGSSLCTGDLEVGPG